MNSSWKEALHSIDQNDIFASSYITQSEKSAIIIGDTGQGKTTLLHYIAGYPLEAKLDPIWGDLNLEAVKDPPFDELKKKELKQFDNIKIGSQTFSMTSVPNKFYTKGITFWDCPGFNDTKGTVQQIVNSIYIKKIFQKSDKFCLIIVISENKIKVRADIFISILKKLEHLFKNLQRVIDSICLILTKTSISGEKIKQFLKTFLTQQKSNLSDGQKKLIETLASEKGNISTFSKPLQEGPICVSSNYKILQMIQSVNFTQKMNIQITINDNALNELVQYGNQINNNIKDYCKNANSQLQKNCLQKITQFNCYKDASEWLQQQKKRVELLKKQVNLKEFFKRFQQICPQNKLLHNLLFQDLKLLKFIKQINSNVCQLQVQWKEQFKILKLIQKLLAEPLAEPQNFDINGSKSVTIKAFIIGMEKIQKLAIQNPKLQQIEILCVHTLYIDKDLSLPGKNLYIIAKNWKINGSRKISLKGADGIDYQTNAKDSKTKTYDGCGITGEDGLPGRPGQSGGSFYGKILSKPFGFGPGKLQIDVSGGNGGNGQNGGDGSQGNPGQNAARQPVEQRNPNCLVKFEAYGWAEKQGYKAFTHAVKKVLTFNDQKIQIYLSKGKQGKPGGDGGKGGIGGKGGQIGQVSFPDFKNVQKNQNPVLVHKEHGKPGKNGKPGNPGKGGRNGDSFKGQYICEQVLGGIRDSIPNSVIGQCTGAAVAVAGLITRQVMKEAAQKATIETIEAFTLGGLVGGLTFGTSALFQMGLSAISANVSDGWKDKYLIEQGYAPGGKINYEVNSKNQQNLTPSKIIMSHAEFLIEQFEKYRSKLLKQLEFNTF